MESENISNQKKHIESKDMFKELRSNYILKKVNDNLQRKKSLKIFKNNKQLQKRLNININDYKKIFRNRNRINTFTK